MSALVFDLDGTLWNACEACAVGWTEGLSELGLNKEITKADVESVCGLTYPDCVRKLCPEISESRLPQAMAVLDRYERERVMQSGGELYEGVLEGLKKLSQIHPLYLVSNCQEWYLRSFLDHSGTTSYFRDWECYGRTQKPKTENLRLLLQRNELKDPIYIGDTETDRKASSEAGFSFIFVSYGFGKMQHRPSFDSFSALVDFFDN